MARKKKRYTRRKRPLRKAARRSLRLSKPAIRRIVRKEPVLSPVRRGVVFTTAPIVKRPTVKPRPIVGQSKNFTKTAKTELTAAKLKRKICLRRRVRKQVMHATRQSGRSGQNKPKWTNESRQSC